MAAGDAGINRRRCSFGRLFPVVEGGLEVLHSVINKHMHGAKAMLLVMNFTPARGLHKFFEFFKFVGLGWGEG